MSLPFRSRVEHATYPLMDRLNRLPRPVVFLVALALVVAGIFVPTFGWVFLALVALFVGFLVWSTWPRSAPQERLMRIAVLAVVVALALVRAFPRR